MQSINIRVQTPEYFSLKQIYPNYTRKELNRTVRSFIKMVTLKYPKGHTEFYSLPGSELVMVNRPVIKFNTCSQNWELTTISIL